jgi:hypothetical protein
MFFAVAYHPKKNNEKISDRFVFWEVVRNQQSKPLFSKVVSVIALE